MQSGVLRDTEQGALAARALAEERLRHALEASVEGLHWDWNIQAGTVWRSDRWRTLLGLAADAAVDIWENDVHPQDAPLRRAALDAYFAGRSERYECEYRMRRTDGPWLWVLARGTLVQRDGSGQPLRMIGTMEDITRRKAIEEELGASEAQLRAVLAAVPVCVKVVAPDGTLVSMNDAGLRMIQAEPGQNLFGKPVIDLVGAGDRAAWLSNHARVCAGETVQWDYEIVGLHGQRVHVETLGAPVRLHDGRTGNLSVSRDVTRRRSAEASLTRLQADAMRASRISAMGAMAAGFAHELSQPLAAVANYAAAASRLLEAVPDAYPSSQELQRVRAIVAKASAQAIRAGETLHRLRDFIARIEPELGFLSPAALVEEACATVVAALGAGSPAGSAPMVRVAVSAMVGEVFADRVQLLQVLTNLIRNAVEAVGGAPDQEVSVLADRTADGDGVVFAVGDSGPGLSADMRARAFEPFVSTKPGGMGIGLAISRILVEAHGGRIWADAGPLGSGTVFRFFIPDADFPLPIDASRQL